MKSGFPFTNLDVACAFILVIITTDLLRIKLSIRANLSLRHTRLQEGQFSSFW